MIVLVYKIGRRCDLGNYRFITHTPIVSGIKGSLLRCGLISYLPKHGLIDTRKHGFLREISCATCLTDCLNYLAKVLNTGRSVIVTILDMRKAFDSVSPKVVT